MKRVLAFLLTGALLATLTACGTPSGTASSKAAASSKPSAASKTGASENTSSAAAEPVPQEKLDAALASFSSHKAATFSNVTVYKDLFYGDRRDLPTEGDGCTTGKTDGFGHGYDRHRSGQNFDLYLPDGVTADAPVMVTIHGGSWCEPMDKDSEEVSGLPTQVASAGYVVADMDYILQTCLTADPNAAIRAEATFDEMLRDVDAMVSYLKTFLPTLGIQPSKIAIAGGSAGGFLATLYAYDQTCPTQLNLKLKHEIPVGYLVDVVGPCDLTCQDWKKVTSALSIASPMYAMTYLKLFGSLIGDPSLTMSDFDKLAKYSAVTMINKNTVPSVLMYNRAPEKDDVVRQATGVETDMMVPVFTYRNLGAALEKAGVPYRGKLYDNQIHGSVDAPWMMQCIKEFTQYLK